ncbi:hypothetical protein NPX13_g7427 [Xylaria arbuscula]|uniref:BZIP domain-containing protein n=1 Tax=Xylaria arbuscula TaxID=114810 RepID=A0A9W8TKF3_9PEZI|nr:hypothetical protein NPX13_g7427 [Xylaria arbuscula]
MATTWEDEQVSQLSVATPQVKFEASPAESFLSTPGGELSDAATPAPDSTPAATPAAEGEKKPVKKRKSWGQVLPEPKTNLPPRKRAKTEDEKEQRRVERVLRNRRAAQSSRERKRQEVEALEQRNAALESALHTQQKQNLALMEELAQLRRSAGVASRSSTPLDAFQPSPLTLSQSLFQEPANGATQPHTGMIEDFILMPSEQDGTQDGTVNLASISPELNPVADSEMKTASSTMTTETEIATAPSTAATTSDVTQHPAAVLCDLQCPADFSLLPSSDIDSWGSQGQLSPSADPIGFEYNNLASDATPELPDFDISQFLSDDVSGAASGATAVYDSIVQDPESAFSFVDFENQVSSETFNQQPHLGASTHGCDDGVLASQGPLMWPVGTSLPSKEALLTLLWALRVEERKGRSHETKNNVSSSSSRPGSSVLREKASTTQTVLLVGGKRKGDGTVNNGGKRMLVRERQNLTAESHHKKLITGATMAPLCSAPDDIRVVLNMARRKVFYSLVSEITAYMRSQLELKSPGQHAHVEDGNPPPYSSTISDPSSRLEASQGSASGRHAPPQPYSQALIRLRKAALLHFDSWRAETLSRLKEVVAKADDQKVIDARRKRAENISIKQKQEAGGDAGDLLSFGDTASTSQPPEPDSKKPLPSDSNAAYDRPASRSRGSVERNTYPLAF